MHKRKFYGVVNCCWKYNNCHNSELEQSDCFSFIAQLWIPVELTAKELRTYKKQSDNRISEYLTLLFPLVYSLLKGYQLIDYDHI